jgi:phosphatidylinositol alpha-mannosyltransferase
LLGAFEGLRAAGIGVELTIVGASPDEVAPLVLDSEGIDVAGRVTEAQKWRLLGEADLLCAPSLGAESFGMVLTEAFAAGTPVIASDIAGYRDVVSDQTDGILVPPGDATALAKAINSLASDPQRRENMAQNARERAKRFSWPQVAAEIVDAYETALTLRKPRNAMQKILLRTGLTPADGGPRKPPRRLESMEQPVPGQRRTRTLALVRKAALVCGTIGGFTLTGLALERIGIGPIVGALLAAAPVWVLLAFGLMCASMLVRAESWHAILRAALPQVSIRRADAVRGTMIGVLMSATLPARLGEVSRAVVVARRLGSVRENLPLVAGTLISQTLFNILALFLLGAATFTSVGLFHGHEAAVALVALVPLSLFLILLVAPGLLGRGIGARYAPLAVAARRIRRASQDARVGLKVFRNPRLGGWAVVSQLFAWVVQWMACYLLLVALGLNAHAGLGAAAAVLFAVNVTAAIPATPSNIGVFQAACIAVLSAYGIAKTDAFAFGIILQAVEVATAFTVGMPAFVREGMSWKDLRARALHAAPVEVTALSPHSGPADV